MSSQLDVGSAQTSGTDSGSCEFGSGSCEDAETCWVCLDTGCDLVQPCKCPRFAHPKCLARWQLQSAGRNEESTCRFCDMKLPDWRPVLTPKDVQPAIPTVSVHYNGVRYRIKIRPGAEGQAQFRQQIAKITGQSVMDCMQITFQCKSPDDAQDLSFKGMSAFDAAIHCAAVSSAQRITSRRSAELARSYGASGGGGWRRASVDGHGVGAALVNRVRRWHLRGDVRETDEEGEETTEPETEGEGSVSTDDAQEAQGASGRRASHPLHFRRFKEMLKKILLKAELHI